MESNKSGSSGEALNSNSMNAFLSTLLMMPHYFLLCRRGIASIIVRHGGRHNLQELLVVYLAGHADVCLAENRLNFPFRQLLAPIRQDRAQNSGINFSCLFGIKRCESVENFVRKLLN